MHGNPAQNQMPKATQIAMPKYQRDARIISTSTAGRRSMLGTRSGKMAMQTVKSFVALQEIPRNAMGRVDGRTKFPIAPAYGM